MLQRRPKLTQRISVDDFKSFYWLKEELSRFAVANEISSSGKKQEIAARIERFLRGKSPAGGARPKRPSGRTSRAPGIRTQGNAEAAQRDSARKLTRKTPVVHYVCDDDTRAFFEEQVGSHFHFTAKLNRYIRSHEGLTYGDLIDEWLAEKERRRDPTYKPRLGKAGEYNQYVRDFFADAANQGKSLKRAAAGWNRVKKERGKRKYRKARGW